jgi:CPA2 family monovalent cation:H+ antiporter-2
MSFTPLAQVLILLLASVLVVAAARRLGLPAILGYLLVGIALGPYSLGLLPANELTQELAEVGVVFLLFTLGLEFSWPRMVVMRREVFGLGALHVLLLGTAGTLVVMQLAVAPPEAIVVGGALAMCSTAIVLQQLGEQAEINRTHGRLSFAVLLFQDLAFVPLLALATSLGTNPGGLSTAAVARLLGGGVVALLTVFAIGRAALRPLLHEIARRRSRELFTLAALLVVLTAAWITQTAGLSMALGAFLAGMLFAESEYRHAIEAVIRPFRELLLGLFFITVGMLLDLRLLERQFGTVLTLAVGLISAKLLLGALAVRPFVSENFKALRTAVVLAGGGEFGVALLTLLLRNSSAAPALQPLLAASVMTMVASPLLVRYNKTITRTLLRQSGPPLTAVQREDAAARAVAQREHVILCGFGRVGQNIARVLELQGFEYLAVDADIRSVRAARAAGDPIIWGDATEEDLLRQVGIATASALIITFDDDANALAVVRAAHRLREDLPALVRSQDDRLLGELSAAGATEVVPETLEASLTLTAQALTLLGLAPARVNEIVGGIRAERYATLREIHRHQGVLELSGDGESELRSVVLPPQAWAVNRRLDEVRHRGADVRFTAVRRKGVTGRQPAGNMELRAGDIVVMYGTSAALEHAEAVLLAG